MSSFTVIHWDDAYSLGDYRIDSEHKNLFEISEKVHNCSNVKEVMQIVRELIKYTKIHFSNEEKYMKSINSSRLEGHKKIHQDIVDELNDTIKRIEKMSFEDSVRNVIKFIYDSLLQHILIEDKRVHHERKTRQELKNALIWRKNYELNDELIDGEHKQLFYLVIRALDYHDDTDMKSHVKLTINELYNYMKTHFKHEEEYMKEIKYPKVKEHKIIHDKIIEQMNEFIRTLPTLPIKEFERKLIEQMDIWLINHILFEDKKILNFKNRNNIIEI